MPTTTANNQQIHYTDSGGDGPAVIATHATLMDIVTLEPLTEKVAAAGYRVVAFDQRHHGKTVSDGSSFSYDDMSGDLLGLADHLGIERFALLVEGSGGMIGMRAAFSAPERVWAAVLIGVSHMAPVSGEADTIKAVIDAWCQEGPRSEIYKQVAKYATATDEDAENLLERWHSTAWSEYGPFGVATASRDGFGDRLATATFPTLCLNASEDVHCSPAIGKDLSERLGGESKFVTIDHPRHCLTFAFRPEVADESVAWLDLHSALANR